MWVEQAEGSSHVSYFIYRVYVNSELECVCVSQTLNVLILRVCTCEWATVDSAAIVCVLANVCGSLSSRASHEG